MSERDGDIPVIMSAGNKDKLEHVAGSYSCEYGRQSREKTGPRTEPWAAPPHSSRKRQRRPRRRPNPAAGSEANLHCTNVEAKGSENKEDLRPKKSKAVAGLVAVTAPALLSVSGSGNYPS